MADVPLELKPEDEPNANFICLDKGKAQRVEACFEREKLYQQELSGEGSSSGVWFLLLGLGLGFTGGIVFTHH